MNENLASRLEILLKKIRQLTNKVDIIKYTIVEKPQSSKFNLDFTDLIEVSDKFLYDPNKFLYKIRTKEDFKNCIQNNRVGSLKEICALNSFDYEKMMKQTNSLSKNNYLENIITLSEINGFHMALIKKNTIKNSLENISKEILVSSETSSCIPMTSIIEELIDIIETFFKFLDKETIMKCNEYSEKIGISEVPMNIFSEIYDFYYKKIISEVDSLQIVDLKALGYFVHQPFIVGKRNENNFQQLLKIYNSFFSIAFESNTFKLMAFEISKLYLYLQFELGKAVKNSNLLLCFDKKILDLVQEFQLSDSNQEEYILLLKNIDKIINSEEELSNFDKNNSPGYSKKSKLIYETIIDTLYEISKRESIEKSISLLEKKFGYKLKGWLAN